MREAVYMIRIENFRGERPAVRDKVLPENMAAVAKNCEFKYGDYRALKGMTQEAATLANNTQAIYLYENAHWFSWSQLVSAVKSPIEQDDYRRVYFSGETISPKVTSNLIATGSGVMPSNSYDLGVQQPSGSIGIVNISAGTGDPEETNDDETRYYTITYVTEYGEEGPPAYASAAAIVPSLDSEVTLSLPIPSTNTQNIVSKRIYRTSGSSEEYFYVAEVPLALGSYVDAVSTDTLGSALETYDYFPPPEDLRGLTAGANGIMAGFVENKLMFSEPYLPYAWPTNYNKSTEHDIVAIAATRTSFVVLTEGYPYVFSGISPDGMNEDKLSVKQACVSARSVVEMGDVILYASPDGLIAVSNNGAQLATKGVFTKEEWASLDPSTIHAYYYEGKYIAFHGGSSGFVFDLENGDITHLDFYAEAGYSDLLTDTLYLSVDDELYSWDSGNDLSPVWRSKEFYGKHRTYRALECVCSKPQNVKIKIWVDGQLVFNRNGLTGNKVKIPPASGSNWQVELTGTEPVELITLAESIDQL
jgi:hypothetical protein